MNKRRVLFPVSTPLSFGVIEPLLLRLAQDSRIEIMVSVRHGGRQLAESCLQVPFTYVPGLAARFRRFDAAVCSGFFFHSSHIGQLVELFHGVSPKNYAVRDEVERFDRLFLIGEYHRRKFVRAGLLEEDDPRGRRIGMPKTDRLVNGDDSGSELIRALELDADLPTIAYAPTRSGASGSSLDEIGLDLIDILSRMPVNLLIKLHDRSLKRFRKKVKVDYERLISDLEPGNRIRLVRSHDVIPCLLAADLLITDLSSVGSEFLLRDRPVIYLSVPEHERKIRTSSERRFGSDDPENLDYLRGAGDVIHGCDQLQVAVERALSDPERASSARRERAELLFYNPGQATEHALRALYELLNLEVP